MPLKISGYSQIGHQAFPFEPARQAKGNWTLINLPLSPASAKASAAVRRLSGVPGQVLLDNMRGRW